MENLKLTVQNFKPFKKCSIEIKPITVLLGPNSSGKSSIIQPFLLLKQTLSSVDNASPLILDGNLIDLGSYADVVFGHKENKEIVFNFSWTVTCPRN